MKEENTTATSNTYTTGCNFMPSCKYRLPCGICDRTGSPCTDFSYPYPRPYYPTGDYPYYWDKVTCSQDTTNTIKSGTTTAK